MCEILLPLAVYVTILIGIHTDSILYLPVGKYNLFRPRERMSALEIELYSQAVAYAKGGRSGKHTTARALSERETNINSQR